MTIHYDHAEPSCKALITVIHTTDGAEVKYWDTSAAGCNMEHITIDWNGNVAFHTGTGGTALENFMEKLKGSEAKNDASASITSPDGSIPESSQDGATACSGQAIQMLIACFAT